LWPWWLDEGFLWLGWRRCALLALKLGRNEAARVVEAHAPKTASSFAKIGSKPAMVLATMLKFTDAFVIKSKGIPL